MAGGVPGRLADLSTPVATGWRRGSLKGRLVPRLPDGYRPGPCSVSEPVRAVDAVCLFSGGTGRLRQFQLEVVVTASDDHNDDQTVWYWDGTYRFGN